MANAQSAGPEETEKFQSPFRRLITTRGLLALVVSNALGFGGEQMRLAAQAWWILEEGGSNSEVGLSAGLRVIPVVLISLYAGVMIDRFGGKRVLLVERWLLVLLAAATALLLMWDGVQIWHIVAISTVAGATIAVGMPATQTLVADIVPSELRTQANLLNQLGPSAGRTVGPLLAGMLIALRNVATAFIGLTVLYAIASLVTHRVPSRASSNTPRGSALLQIREGLVYVRKTPVLFWLMFMQFFSVIFFATVFVVIPAIAVEVIGATKVQYGWMWGAMSLGQATTAIGLTRFGTFRRNSPALLSAVMIFSTGFLLMIFTSNYAVLMTLLVVMGLAFPLWAATQNTMLQNFADDEYRGRVMAVYAIALQGLALSWLFGGWMLDLVGINGTIVISVAGGCAVVAIAMLASKDLRSA